MNNIKFKDIIEALKIGREIEFVYNKKKYSITNSNGYWYFCCDTNNMLTKKLCKFDEKDLLISKVTIITIDGVLISDIFNNLKYDISKLYIL